MIFTKYIFIIKNEVNIVMQNTYIDNIKIYSLMYTERHIDIL